MPKTVYKHTCPDCKKRYDCGQDTCTAGEIEKCTGCGSENLRLHSGPQEKSYYRLEKKPFNMKVFCPNCNNVIEVTGEWRTVVTINGSSANYTVLVIDNQYCNCWRVKGQCHICGIKDSEHTPSEIERCIEKDNGDPFVNRLTSDQMIDIGRKLKYY